MAVIVLIESGIALKPERLPLEEDLHYWCPYSQREKQAWASLAGRSHADSERFRILSDAVWSLPGTSHLGAVYEAPKNIVTSEYPS